jgi:hypothetical protein
MLPRMAVNIGDLKAIEEQHHRMQQTAGLAAEAIRTYRQLERATDMRRTYETIGPAAIAAATDIRRTYQTIGPAAEAIRTYRQLQQMTERHSAGTAVRPRETVPPIDALVVDALVGIAPAGVDWPPLGRFTLRVLLATVTLALIILVWEEGREEAPAVTLAVIYGLVSGWQQFDEAIRKDS